MRRWYAEAAAKLAGLDPLEGHELLPAAPAAEQADLARRQFGHLGEESKQGIVGTTLHRRCRKAHAQHTILPAGDCVTVAAGRYPHA